MESEDDTGGADYDYNSGEEYAYDDGNESDEEEERFAEIKDVSGNQTGKTAGERSSTGGSSGKTALSGKIPEGKVIITEYQEIVPLMEAVTREVSTLLDIDYDSAQILLQSYRWDKERLIDAFFGNPEKVFLDTGLDKYNQAMIDAMLRGSKTVGATSSAASASQAVTAESTFVCRICCDDVVSSDALSLGCGHKFCRICYSEYLRNQVNDGPSCIRAQCPEHKCSQSVPRSFFTILLDEPISERYSMFVMRNYIETSKNMRYCPAPGCAKVAIGSGVTKVNCTCSNPFCFRCGEEAHDPCSCTQLAEWSLKCINESETANWILANTKKCPKCNTRIEKNQGCNHMNCKLCKYEFCWICMGSWADHGQNTGGFYKCNRFDAIKTDGSSSAAQKAKAELERYLHYYQRFHGHDSALKFAAGQREAAERRMVERQEAHRSTWIDVQFLKHAAEQVIDCRRVLKYSYALGYFLENESLEKQLFEHHQELLEKNTEKLHEYTEQSLDVIDRTQVVNLTRVTERFMASLLATIIGGVVDINMDMMTSTGVQDGNGNGLDYTVTSSSSASAT